MKADVPQTVLCQGAAKVSGQIGRADALAQLVEADVPFISAAVRLAAQALALLLLGFQAQEHVPHRRHQRQCPAAGAGFRGVRGDDRILAIDGTAGDCVSDGEGALLKVDGIPAQAHDLAAPQSIEGGQLHRHLDVRARHSRKQRVQLALGVEARLIGALAGAVHLVGGIHRDEVGLDRVAQRPVQNGVVVNDRVGLHPLALLHVKRLDVSGRQALERDALLAEPRFNGVAQQPAVGAVGAFGDGGAGDLQPALEIVCKQLIPSGTGRVRCRNHEVLPLLHQKRLGPLLVALHRQAGRQPLGLALVVRALVAQHGVVVALLFLQMSCDHTVSSLLCRGFPACLCPLVRARHPQVGQQMHLGNAVGAAHLHGGDFAGANQFVAGLGAHAQRTAHFFDVHHVRVVLEHDAVCVFQGISHACLLRRRQSKFLKAWQI